VKKKTTTSTTRIAPIAPSSLLEAGERAFLDTMGFLPQLGRLARVDYEAALNIERRWKKSDFYPRPATEVPGRVAARLRKSCRRLSKRTARLLGRGITIGGVAGTK